MSSSNLRPPRRRCSMRWAGVCSVCGGGRKGEVSGNGMDDIDVAEVGREGVDEGGRGGRPMDQHERLRGQ